ncbi:MAG TPA: ABC transporter permease [Myxococcaceae bacterium]
MSWLRRLVGRRESLRGLSEELRSHLEERTDALVAEGMERAAAAAQARHELGNLTAIEEAAREVWRWPVVETFAADVRRAVRMLRKSPGFAAAAILTLALGLGANAAVFSVVYAVLLRPLPFPHSERLVRVFSVRDGLTVGPSPPDIRDFARESRSFEILVAYDTWRKNLATPGGEPAQIRVGLVPADYFRALSIRPLAGRLFTEEENRWGSHHVAVVSRSFWADRFGSSALLDGQSIRINDEPYLVVGIVPDSIPAWMDPASEQVRVWTPFAPSPGVWDESGRGDRSGRGFSTLGRLAPGVSLAQANAELRSIAEDLGRRHPVDAGVGVRVEPLLGTRVASLRPTLSMVMAAVGLILLLACLNVATLLVARNATRGQEFAIRTALGAGRARLASQLLAETLLLTGLGALAGLGLSWAATALLARIGPERMPQLAEARIDGTVLAFTVCVALVTSVVFGVLPALLGTAAAPADVLRTAGGRTGTGGPGHRTLRRVLATVQISLSLVLLVGAGLLVHGLLRLQSEDMGFRRDHLLTQHLFLPEVRYPDPSRITEFSDRYVARVRELAGVRDAAVTDVVPPSYRWRVGFTVVGQAPPGRDAVPTANFGVADAHLVRTLELRLLRGRDLGESDTATSPRVILVNEAFARRYFPGADPVGQRIEIGEPGTEPAASRPVLTIIGVVADTPNGGVAAPADPDILGLFRQNPEQNFGFKTVVVRTTVPPSSVAPALREVLRSLDPDLPFAEVRTMEQILARETTEGRFATWLFGAFAVVGLALAAVGIYGLVAYLVTLRGREFAVRFALGARTADVVRLVGGEGARVGLVGMGVGLLCALAAAQGASALLYGLSPRDPAAFLGGAGALVVVLVSAIAAPCVRAARIEARAALGVQGE